MALLNIKSNNQQTNHQNNNGIMLPSQIIFIQIMKRVSQSQFPVKFVSMQLQKPSYRAPKPQNYRAMNCYSAGLKKNAFQIEANHKNSDQSYSSIIKKTKKPIPLQLPKSKAQIACFYPNKRLMSCNKVSYESLYKKSNQGASEIKKKPKYYSSETDKNSTTLQKKSTSIKMVQHIQTQAQRQYVEKQDLMQSIKTEQIFPVTKRNLIKQSQPKSISWTQADERKVSDRKYRPNLKNIEGLKVKLNLINLSEHIKPSKHSPNKNSFHPSPVKTASHKLEIISSKMEKLQKLNNEFSQILTSNKIKNRHRQKKSSPAPLSSPDQPKINSQTFEVTLCHKITKEYRNPKNSGSTQQKQMKIDGWDFQPTDAEAYGPFSEKQQTPIYM